MLYKTCQYLTTIVTDIEGKTKSATDFYVIL